MSATFKQHICEMLFERCCCYIKKLNCYKVVSLTVITNHFLWQCSR